MNHRNRRALACCTLTLLGLAPLHAQAPPDASTTPDAPAQAPPPADTAGVVAQAHADQEAGRYADALALLQAPIPGAPAAASPSDAKALRLAVADVQYAWARSLEDDSPAQALPHFQAALAIDRAQRPAAAADDLNEAGIAYERLNQHGRSADACRQALALYGRAGDRNGEAKALDNMGIAYKYLGQYSKAIGLYQRAIVLHRQAGDKDGQADALGQYGKAVGCHRQALLLFQQAGDKDGAAEARDNLDLARKCLKSR